MDFGKDKAAHSPNELRLARESVKQDERIKQLEADNKVLEDDLIEFGGHQAGCLAKFNKKDKRWKCSCGWKKVKQALPGGKDNDGK